MEEDERFSPLVLRWSLAEQLTRIRKATRMSAAEAASRAGWHPAKVSRIENHGVAVTAGDVRVLLGIYGVSNPADVGPLADMAVRAATRGWWQDYAPILPPDQVVFCGLEAGADEERDYRGGLIPDLLQVPGYARHVLALRPARRGSRDTGLQQYLDLLAHRQQLLRHPARPMRLHAVIDEPVLARRVGDAAVMYEQLLHLASAGVAPGITIQVLPAAAPHPALDMPFRLLLLTGQYIPGAADLGHSHQLTGGTDLDYYAGIFEELIAAAFSPGRSRELILHYAASLDT